ncbi:hypothetical protein GBA52_006461 [Prunus armeniaca]|nr:hypothetical protein GBA52_006461 [Prunus armeniaca]
MDQVMSPKIFVSGQGIDFNFKVGHFNLVDVRVAPLESLSSGDRVEVVVVMKVELVVVVEVVVGMTVVKVVVDVEVLEEVVEVEVDEAVV